MKIVLYKKVPMESEPYIMDALDSLLEKEKLKRLSKELKSVHFETLCFLKYWNFERFSMLNYLSLEIIEIEHALKIRYTIVSYRFYLLLSVFFIGTVKMTNWLEAIALTAVFGLIYYLGILFFHRMYFFGIVKKSLKQD